MLVILSAFIWLVVLAANLNVYDSIYAAVKGWLDMPRTMGSISVRLGNILIFVLIVYISNVLQKYLGYLFGEQDAHSLPQDGKKGIVRDMGIRSSRLVTEEGGQYKPDPEPEKRDPPAYVRQAPGKGDKDRMRKCR